MVELNADGDDGDVRRIALRNAQLRREVQRERRESRKRTFSEIDADGDGNEDEEDGDAVMNGTAATASQFVDDGDEEEDGDGDAKEDGYVVVSKDAVHLRSFSRRSFDNSDYSAHSVHRCSAKLKRYSLIFAM